MKRAATWCLINSVFPILLYLGLWREIKGFENLLVFVCWVNLAVNASTLLENEAKRKLRLERGREVPRCVSSGLDLMVVYCLVFAGHLWTAGAILLAIVFDDAIWDGHL